VATSSPISIAGAPTTPLAKRLLTVTDERVGIPVVAFGSVWVKTGAGEVLRLDPSTGKVTQTYPTKTAAPSSCEGIGATKDAVWVCRAPGTYVRFTPAGRTSTAKFDGYGDQQRIPVLDDQLWLVGKDQTTLHSLDATTGKETGTAITLPSSSCNNVATGLGAVWVACDDLGLVRVDPSTREVSGTAAWPNAFYVAADQHLVVGGDQGVAEIDPDSLAVIASYDVKPDYYGDLTTSGDHAWVGTSGNAPLTRLDLATKTAGEVLTTDDFFEFVGVTMAGNVVWVSDTNDNAARYRVLSLRTSTS
jgi:streptogramin lyase